MKNLMIVLGALVLIPLALIYALLSWGLVIYKFWYWFLIPIFPDLPEITYALAIGLMLFIGLFKTALPSFKDNVLDKTSGLINQFLYPWIVLLIGYLTYIFII